MAKKRGRDRRRTKVSARQKRRLRSTLAAVDLLGKLGVLDELPVLDAYLDARGEPVERVRLGGEDVVIHYRDVPDSDITTVDGIRCTTPLRTVIDMAPEVDAAELDRMIGFFLRRGMFTVAEAMARLDEPDMADDLGAEIVRCWLADAE